MSQTLLSRLVLAAATVPLLLTAQVTVKRVPAHSTNAVAGQDLYREYCAVCHGSDAKGGGPAAAALKMAPSDLTTISRRNGGKYPEVKVLRSINGQGANIPAHGSADMPIWGQIFRSVSSDQNLSDMRVYNLVKYLEKIQVK